MKLAYRRILFLVLFAPGLAACGEEVDLREEWQEHIGEDGGERLGERPADGTAGPEEPGQQGEEVPFEGTAGILEKEPPRAPPAVLTEVRSGRNRGFDRVVFEFTGGGLPGYHLEYIDRPIRDCGSGEPFEVAGEGWLRVRLQPARAHTFEGEGARATVENRNRAPALPNLVALRLTCDFEANLEWVLGVRSPNRYRVFELREPARLVVDVLH